MSFDTPYLGVAAAGAVLGLMLGVCIALVVNAARARARATRPEL